MYTSEQIATHIIENGYHFLDENLNQDGSVNWNKVSADVWMDMDAEFLDHDTFEEAVSFVIEAEANSYMGKHA